MEAIADDRQASCSRRPQRGQNLHLVADCLEAVSQPLELEPRTFAATAHSLPRRGRDAVTCGFGVAAFSVTDFHHKLEAHIAHKNLVDGENQKAV
jgi:hypothetical protein